MTTSPTGITEVQRVMGGSDIRVDPYGDWIKRQNLPIYTGHFVEDLNTMELAPWALTGGRGAIIDLIGSERSTGAYAGEILPGGQLKPQRHLFEETVYILSGRGATTVWTADSPRRSFEWQAGSLFSIPLNTSYQLHNGSGTDPARYVAVHTLPLLLNYFHNDEFIFNNPFVFTDRFDGRESYFSDEGKFVGARNLETNFIPDARSLQLRTWEERGGGGSHISFELSGNTFGSHVSDFAPGEYKKAHRHGGGAHILILAGEGYSLMWPEGGDKVRVSWKPGAFFSPPDVWWHQHFNTSGEPARYLAFRWGSYKWRMPMVFQPDERLGAGRVQIEYEEEEPEIRQTFEAERLQWRTRRASP